MVHAFSIGEVLKKGFEAYKKQFLVNVLALLVIMVLGAVAAFIDTTLFEKILGFKNLKITLFNPLITIYLSIGLLRIWLTIMSGKQAKLGLLVSGAKVFITYFFASILINICISIGLALLIIPGIIIAIGFSMANLFIVDKDSAVIEAMVKSWHITKGNRMNLFLFFLALVGINLLGAAICGLGIFISAPVSGLATVQVYRDLLGE